MYSSFSIIDLKIEISSKRVSFLQIQTEIIVTKNKYCFVIFIQFQELLTIIDDFLHLPYYCFAHYLYNIGEEYACWRYLKKNKSVLHMLTISIFTYHLYIYHQMLKTSWWIFLYSMSLNLMGTKWLNFQ